MPLRQITEDDLPLVRTWRNAPAVRRNMYTKHEITETEHRAWFSRLKDDAQSRWLIHENSEGRANGVVYFTQIQPSNRSAFWGFYAADTAPPGTGTRMEFDALDKAFLELGLHKLNCEVLVSNRQVVNLHMKFGFIEEGIFRDFHFDGKNYVNVVRLGILATEWASKREEIQTRITKLNSHAATSIGEGIQHCDPDT
jgi:UDP-4-amino-4,6-dideoxy-N-acetyl-beta-L-altrosamine N-acetyltransferase